MAANSPTPEGDAPAKDPASTLDGGTSSTESKPLTIVLREDLLRKLKVIALIREISVSELVAEAAAGIVRRDLKKALAKLEG